MPLTVKDNSLGSGVFCGHLTLTPICLWLPALDSAFHPWGKEVQLLGERGMLKTKAVEGGNLLMKYSSESF